MENTALLPALPETTIANSRILSADRETVFRAFTDPATLQRWWGPYGFTNAFSEFDPRAGGRWAFTMHGPNGGVYLNECEFIAVDAPAFIAWNHCSAPFFQAVFHFTSVDERSTRVSYQMIFRTSEERIRVQSFAPEKNEENMDRLAAVLAGVAIP